MSNQNHMQRVSMPLPHPQWVAEMKQAIAEGDVRAVVKMTEWLSHLQDYSHLPDVCRELKLVGFNPYMSGGIAQFQNSSVISGVLYAMAQVADAGMQTHQLAAKKMANEHELRMRGMASPMQPSTPHSVFNHFPGTPNMFPGWPGMVPGYGYRVGDPTPEEQRRFSAGDPNPFMAGTATPEGTPDHRTMSRDELLRYVDQIVTVSNQIAAQATQMAGSLAALNKRLSVLEVWAGGGANPSRRAADQRNPRPDPVLRQENTVTLNTALNVYELRIPGSENAPGPKTILVGHLPVETANTLISLGFKHKDVLTHVSGGVWAAPNPKQTEKEPEYALQFKVAETDNFKTVGDLQQPEYGLIRGMGYANDYQLVRINTDTMGVIKSDITQPLPPGTPISVSTLTRDSKDMLNLHKLFIKEGSTIVIYDSRVNPTSPFAILPPEELPDNRDEPTMHSLRAAAEAGFQSLNPRL